MEIKLCENKHVIINEYLDECVECGSKTFSTLEKYTSEHILEMAKEHINKKIPDKCTSHILADEALLKKVREIDKEFAKHYEEIRDLYGFHYS